MIIKKIAPFVVLSFLTIQMSYGQGSSEHQYNLEETKCIVSFPGEFKQSVTEDDISKTYKATCKSEGMLFMVNVRAYDLDAETEEIIEEAKDEYLLATLENFRAQLEGEILMTVDDENNGIEGKIATMDVGGNKVFYSVYINGGMEYQVVVMEIETGTFNDKMINSFKKSFKILE